MSRARDLLMFLLTLYFLPAFLFLTWYWIRREHRIALVYGFTSLTLGELLAGKAYEFGLISVKPIDVVARGFP